MIENSSMPLTHVYTFGRQRFGAFVIDDPNYLAHPPPRSRGEELTFIHHFIVACHQLWWHSLFWELQNGQPDSFVRRQILLQTLPQANQ